jgi:hypothetical protein
VRKCVCDKKKSTKKKGGRVEPEEALSAGESGQAGRQSKYGEKRKKKTDEMPMREKK